MPRRAIRSALILRTISAAPSGYRRVPSLATTCGTKPCAASWPTYCWVQSAPTLTPRLVKTNCDSLMQHLVSRPIGTSTTCVPVNHELMFQYSPRKGRVNGTAQTSPEEADKQPRKATDGSGYCLCDAGFLEWSDVSIRRRTGARNGGDQGARHGPGINPTPAGDHPKLSHSCNDRARQTRRRSVPRPGEFQRHRSCSPNCQSDNQWPDDHLLRNVPLGLQCREARLVDSVGPRARIRQETLSVPIQQMREVFSRYSAQGRRPASDNILR